MSIILDMEFLVEDNHVHHIGYGVNNDIGGIQVLMAVNGLVINILSLLFKERVFFLNRYLN